MATFNQKIIAIMLVFIGVMLLLVNIGVISLEIKTLFVTYFPVLIVLYGLKLMIDTIYRRKQALFISVTLLVFGGLLVLDRVGLIHFELSMIWKLWPLLFIYLGIKLFIRKKPVKVTVTKGDHDFTFFSEDHEVPKYQTEPNYKEIKKPPPPKKVITIGEIKMNKPNWSVEPLTLKTVVGDYYFDFSKAYIPDKETPIEIKGMVADLKMLVPEDLPIRIDAYVKMGKVRVFDEVSQGKSSRIIYESPNYSSATRKLNIALDLKIGDVRIDRI
ncbi:cell wall-active antibiotics response protein LiaF [Sutcliffiella halmapala]|uniref:cell wall-active antibiotics response protein LiaF n=1 Tax=Sutcliffiella halmapala TaxID=79882 RepID=UPI0009956FB8|nr:cell wall-active antibiotics response protein LiaF [Sutcliffiella halmapala]